MDSGVQQDILWRNPTSGDLGLWAMNGVMATGFDRQLTLASAIAPDWKVAGTGDFNGDGNDDVLMRRQSNGEIEIRLMRGSEIIQTTNLGVVGSTWLVEGVGDFNGDQKADILWRWATQQKLGIWLMDSTSLTQSTVINIDVTSYKVEGVGDLNADGKSDILFRNTAGQVAYWLMNGLAIVGSAVTGYTVAATDYKFEGVRDFNGDGQADILWRYLQPNNPAVAQGTKAVWLNDASTTTVLFPTQAFSAGAPLAYSTPGIKDWDGDGKADVLWRQASGATVLWLISLHYS